MEEVAWRYVERGDVASAERLFQTLANTFSYGRLSASTNGGAYQKYVRLCKVVMNPRAVPMPERANDAVEALLEERFPLSAFFNSSCMNNTSTLNTWFLLVHPDKNAHPRAREAFVRLMAMKETLAKDGLLSAAGLAMSQPMPVNDVKTPVPIVVNERRLEREQMRRQGELDGLMKSLSKKRKVRLQCNLAASEFEKLLKARDCTLSSEGEGFSGSSTVRSTTIPRSEKDLDGADDTLDEGTLTRTIVLEGLSKANLSESARAEIKEAFSACNFSKVNSPSSVSVGGGSGGDERLSTTTHRIVLRRPPTLDEWRLERLQQELGETQKDSQLPTVSGRRDSSHHPKASVARASFHQTDHAPTNKPCSKSRTPSNACSEASRRNPTDREGFVLPDLPHRGRVVSPAASQSSAGRMKEFVMPL